MPTSHPRTISVVHSSVIELSPMSIIDIGIGHGKTAVIAREYLEMWSDRCFHKQSWKRKIYGIESFADYRNPLWDYAYDRVEVCDAMDGLELFPQVDLILALDIWEHFEPDYAHRLLAKCLSQARFVIISTPIKPNPQDDAYGNPNERHVSVWRPKDFSQVPHKAFLTNGEDWCIIVSAREPIPRSISRKGSLLNLLSTTLKQARYLCRF